MLRFSGYLIILLLVCLGLVMGYLLIRGPHYGEKLLVDVVPFEHQPIPENVKAMHERLFVADLHADPLLWARDLAKRADYSHVDVPRLIDGNVGLQVFGVVSQISPVHNVDYNPDNDAFPLLAFSQRWPASTWFSIPNRGVYQAKKLYDVAKRSNGALQIVTTKQDLLKVLAGKLSRQWVVGGLLAFEGVQVLEGSMERYHKFYKLGYRMMGLTHFFDTEAAGSRHGVKKYGLTEFGEELVGQMEKDGVVVDLAHASAKATTEVLAFATNPVVVSHTGVKGVCNNRRNLADEHIRGVAKLKGVIGIGYWPSAACDVAPKEIVKSIRYVADMVGVDYVGLGSDFDGAVATSFDTSELAVLTHALHSDGFSEEDISKIMGGNVVRLLLEVLPDATESHGQ
ncbi:MAG: membrane dipeptidase [Pseudomonadales bacterium]|nr:membrane dipeptidase [Pseudomonadales bacterium]